MEAVEIPIAELYEDPENARVHPERNLDAIARSLDEYGQMKPIVVRPRDSDGGYRVVAGSGTLRAARERLGWEALWAIVTDLPIEKAKAYGLADNKTSELAEWDYQVVSDLLRGMDQEDWPSTGFDATEITALMNLAAKAGDEKTAKQKDDLPDIGEATRVRPGDVWKLDGHTVICDDSTKVDLTPHAAEVHIVWTDPPYGVDYQGGGATKRTRARIQSDNLTSPLHDLLRDVFERIAQRAIDKMPFYVCTGFSTSGRKEPTLCSIANGITAGGGRPVMQLIWVKNNSTFALGRTRYNYRHEVILHGWMTRGKGKAPWYAGATKETVLFFDRPSTSELHPTMKPVALITDLLSHSARSGEVVVDPFLGSGSTLIAAEDLKMRCVGIEIEPFYAEQAIVRWENLYGKTATLASRKEDA